MQARKRNSSLQRPPTVSDRPVLTGRIAKKPGKRKQRWIKLLLVVLVVCLFVVHIHYVVQHNKTAPDSAGSTRTGFNVDPLRKVRLEFYKRYGGQEAAESMLQDAVEQFGSIEATANRMSLALKEKRPLQLSFAGYSVTVGRGNYFHQSFPFVVQRVLEGPLKQSLGLSITTKNAAIGGIPSFPYAFCLPHFLGNPDVVSWDYGMNEGNGAAVFESYLRHAMALPKRPMVIVLDNNANRKNLLEKYTQQSFVRDAIIVSRAPKYEEKPGSPPGLQHWNEFGAPKGCPGQGPWHPKKMEHEWIGWMIAMHFVKAAEVLALEKIATKQTAAPHFGAPLQTIQNDKPVSDMMYNVGKISCRTSFLPATDHSFVLPSLVVSGLSENVPDSMMEDRTDAHYKSGWVLDVSKIERETKRKVERCGGLGYIDMKVALYGIPESGMLRLWLPYEGSTGGARLTGLLFCEANEKRSQQACQLDEDLNYKVGGVQASHISNINGAGEYLKRKTCVHVEIPLEAQMTAFRDVKTLDGTEVSSRAQDRLEAGGRVHSDTMGMIVDISIQRANVSRSDGACCLSHVVWHQQ